MPSRSASRAAQRIHVASVLVTIPFTPPRLNAFQGRAAEAAQRSIRSAGRYPRAPGARRPRLEQSAETACSLLPAFPLLLRHRPRALVADRPGRRGQVGAEFPARFDDV